MLHNKKNIFNGHICSYTTFILASPVVQYTSFTKFSSKYLVICKGYNGVGGIKNSDCPHLYVQSGIMHELPPRTGGHPMA